MFFIIEKNSNQFLLQKKKEKYIDIESVTDPRRDPTRKNARKNLSNPIYHIEKRGANERDSHRFPNCFVKKKKWKKEEEEEEENERRRRREGQKTRDQVFLNPRGISRIRHSLFLSLSLSPGLEASRHVVNPWRGGERNDMFQISPPVVPLPRFDRPFEFISGAYFDHPENKRTNSSSTGPEAEFRSATCAREENVL